MPLGLQSYGVVKNISKVTEYITLLSSDLRIATINSNIINGVSVFILLLGSLDLQHNEMRCGCVTRLLVAQLLYLV